MIVRPKLISIIGLGFFAVGKTKKRRKKHDSKRTENNVPGFF